MDADKSIETHTEQHLRHDWPLDEVLSLFESAFIDLLMQAQEQHRRYFLPNQVQLSKLISVKTGGCEEDCAYCPQSSHYHTSVAAEKIMEIEEVLAEARIAKEEGATRFCMGAAWREPKDRDLDKICAMIEGVRALGMESCATLGMVSDNQAARLKSSGLDYYNHNLDTSERFYSKIITTRTYQSRLDSLDSIRQAGIKVCCGGILGMGEERQDRAELLITLANLDEHPESVPINMLIPIEGTPLGQQPQFDSFEFVRTIAVAKIIMPSSVIRLSAGREQMSEEMQALCFMAGAGSIFIGDKLLTAPNNGRSQDDVMLAKLGISGSPTATVAS